MVKGLKLMKYKKHKISAPLSSQPSARSVASHVLQFLEATKPSRCVPS